MAALALRLCSARRPQRGRFQTGSKRPVETVVGNVRFWDTGGGTGMTGDGWISDRRLPATGISSQSLSSSDKSSPKCFLTEAAS